MLVGSRAARAWPLGALALACGAGGASVWLLSLADQGRGRAAVLSVLLLAGVVVLPAAVLRSSWVGVVAGAALWGGHIVGWTLEEPGLILAAVQLGWLFVLALVTAWRPPRTFRVPFPFWLGVIPVAVGATGAAVQGAGLVAAGRGASAALLAAWLGATRRFDWARVGWGIVAGTHLAFAGLLGCGLVAPLAETRFAGGACAQTHPNIIGMAAWTAGIAWLALPAEGLRAGTRGLGVAVAAALLVLTDARTAGGAGLVAASVLFAMWLRGAPRGGRLARGLTTGAVALMLVAAGGLLASPFFVRERSPGVGPLSGRERIWSAALQDWRAAPAVAKLLGTSAGGVGARVELPGQPAPTGQGFTTHNAFVGVLRRAGIVGLVAATIGLSGAIRALVSALSGRRSRWGAAMLAGALATVAVEDWLFGGSLFLWVALAGASLSDRDRTRGRPPTTPSAPLVRRQGAGSAAP